MKLMFTDRMMLMGILPATGSFTTLKIVRKLREDLAPSEKEIKEMSIVEKPEDGQVLWNSDKDLGKDIKIGEIATEMIKKKLKEMNDKEELTPNHMGIYEIFVGD